MFAAARLLYACPEDIRLVAEALFRDRFRPALPGLCERKRRQRLFAIKERCPSCGARFERGDSGHWLVASTLNYFFNALLCILLTVFLVQRYGFFSGLAWIVVGVALAALLYRPSKALGLWILWLFGFIE